MNSNSLGTLIALVFALLALAMVMVLFMREAAPVPVPVPQPVEATPTNAKEAEPETKVPDVVIQESVVPWYSNQRYPSFWYYEYPFARYYGAWGDYYGAPSFNTGYYGSRRPWHTHHGGHIGHGGHGGHRR